MKDAPRSPVALALSSFLISGCGAGTAAVAAGSGGSGSGSSPGLNAFVVEQPKVSPCRLRLEATRATRVALTYDAGAGEQPMTWLSGPGVTGGEVDLPASAVELEWDFAGELGDDAFRAGVMLRVKRGDTVLSGGALVVGIGNDVPVVDEVLVPAQETGGNVAISLRVSDSSADVVSLLAEWRRESDPPDEWLPATAAGIFPGRIATDPDGVELTYFWDTGTDLDGAEADVRVRFTPDDGTLGPDGAPLGLGAPREGASFRVDNNEAPIVLLDSGPLVTNPDERRGIPVRYRVLDSEGDEVEVVFQWRTVDEPFVPIDLDQLDAILADPDLRREHRICTPFRGRLDPLESLDSSSVRVPGLAGKDSTARESITLGETLEVHRSTAFVDLRSRWAADPLDAPTHTLALRDGLSALVVDAPLSGGGDRLREIELATGRIVRELGAVAGTVRGLALEPGGVAVHVADATADGIWHLARLDLASGALDELASDFTGGEPVGGVAALGSRLAVVTLGRQLLLVDATDPVEVRVRSAYLGAEQLNGVVRDSLRPLGVYVAEYDDPFGPGNGRVVAVDLDSGAVRPVQPEGTATPLVKPRSLALEDGDRLLCGSSSGLVQALDLGVARAVPEELRVLGQHSISTGPEGLRLVDLSASGGTEQRRAVAERDPLTGVVRVTEPFDPPLGPGQTARLLPGSTLRATPAGRRETFVWDASDVACTCDVALRAFARDTEAGRFIETESSKPVRGALEGERWDVPEDEARKVDVADVDGDGDMDLVVAAGDAGVAILFQSEAGDFPDPPLRLPILGSAYDVLATDLDADGDCDLVVTKWGNSPPVPSVNVFTQDAAGAFTQTQLFGGTIGARRPQVADMDSDGDLDLVVEQILPVGISIYFREGEAFDPEPLTLGGTSTYLADLDGDGDIDVCQADGRNNTWTLGAHYQTGPRQFEPARIGPSVLVNSPVLAADLNGDGAIDIAAYRPSGNLGVFVRVGPRDYEALPFALVTESAQVSDMAAADLDANGLPDLVLASGIAFLQTAPGEFDREPRGFAEDGAVVGYGIRVADLDADGDLDVITSSPFGSIPAGSTVHRGLAARPAFPGGEFIGLSSSGDGYQIVDVDADGDLDFVVGTSPNGVLVRLQLAPGVFEGSARLLNLPPSSSFGANSRTGFPDLDGDGDVDLVVLDGEDRSLIVFRQSSPGTYDPPVVLADALFDFRAFDVDGDGALDLVTDSQDTPGSLVIYLQTQPGADGGFVFDPPRSISVDGQILSVILDRTTAADLDGNGRPELACWNTRDGNLVVLFQVGRGTFDPLPLVIHQPSIAQPRILAVDLDLDGLEDLLIRTRAFADSSLAFYATGSRDLEQVSITGACCADATPAGDLNGDGLVDLLFASGSSSLLAKLNLGATRNFESSVVLPLLTPVNTGFVAADVDGDGDMDVLARSSGTWHLFLHRGGLPDPWSRQVLQIPDGLSPRSGEPQVVDLDGDGERDIVVAVTGGAVVFWGGR